MDRGVIVEEGHQKKSRESANGAVRNRSYQSINLIGEVLSVMMRIGLFCGVEKCKRMLTKSRMLAKYLEKSCNESCEVLNVKQ